MKKDQLHLVIKRFLHKFILWYLRRCGNAFHTGPYNNYGESNKGGMYIVAMDDDTYHHFRVLATDRVKEEFHMMVWLLRDANIYVP